MGYLHINNLYKDQTILLFKECYALEKVHGTSAHVGVRCRDGKPRVSYFAGGAVHSEFLKTVPDESEMLRLYEEHIHNNADVIFYGEAYGGKMQAMKATYGPELCFIVFDVKINDNWLTVPRAEALAQSFGFEFVPWARCSTCLEDLDAQRDRESRVAIRRGMGEGHKMEGVVLRPLIEMTLSNGDRVIVKHKRTDFQETRTPRVVGDNLTILMEAQAIAEEWVTPMRLQHVLDHLAATGVDTGTEAAIPSVIKAMLEDVGREGRGEYIDSKAARRAISRQAALVFKQHLRNTLKEV